MSTFVYECKKNGQSIDFEIEEMPAVSIAYAIRRGLREYFDNFHASVTKAGLVKGKTLVAWADENEYTETVESYLNEALVRLMNGDVPGSRAPAQPKKKDPIRVLAEQLGLTEEEAMRRLATPSQVDTAIEAAA